MFSICILFILSWVSVFGIAWLQIMDVITMWPSSIYLVVFIFLGLLALGNIITKEQLPKNTKTSSDRVRGVK